MVANRSLLFIACIVWLIAGFNIINIGVIAYREHLTLINIVLSVMIFLIFWFMIFKKLVNKHTSRIKSYTTKKQYFWKFFDFKSFMIMAFMMTFGITIRIFNLLPNTFIAFFYTGLGTALALAGLKFAFNYIQYNTK